MQPTTSYILGNFAGLSTGLITALTANEGVKAVCSGYTPRNRLMIESGSGTAMNQLISFLIENNSPFWSGFTSGLTMSTFISNKRIATLQGIERLKKDQPSLVESQQFKTEISNSSLKNVAGIAVGALFSTAAHRIGLDTIAIPFSQILGGIVGYETVFSAEAAYKAHQKTE